MNPHSMYPSALHLASHTRGSLISLGPLGEPSRRKWGEGLSLKRRSLPPGAESQRLGPTTNLSARYADPRAFDQNLTGCSAHHRTACEPRVVLPIRDFAGVLPWGPPRPASPPAFVSGTCLQHRGTTWSPRHRDLNHAWTALEARQCGACLESTPPTREARVRARHRGTLLAYGRALMRMPQYVCSCSSQSEWTRKEGWRGSTPADRSYRGQLACLS